MKTIEEKDLCTDGNFKDFMKSIRVAVDRLLNEGQDKPIPVTIELTAQWYDHDKEAFRGMLVPCHIIWAAITFGRHSFSIGDSEFTRNHSSKKALHNLVTVRFIDGLWSIEDLRERDFEILRRFDPKHETPDDYLH